MFRKVRERERRRNWYLTKKNGVDDELSSRCKECYDYIQFKICQIINLGC